MRIQGVPRTLETASSSSSSPPDFPCNTNSSVLMIRLDLGRHKWCNGSLPGWGLGTKKTPQRADAQAREMVFYPHGALSKAGRCQSAFVGYSDDWVLGNSNLGNPIEPKQAIAPLGSVEFAPQRPTTPNRDHDARALARPSRRPGKARRARHRRVAGMCRGRYRSKARFSASR
jgi:hypothetical protein